jgi:hypothetical protein
MHATMPTGVFRGLGFAGGKKKRKKERKKGRKEKKTKPRVARIDLRSSQMG